MSHVLLVDDEPAITESLAYAFERAGYHTTAAATLSEAQRALERGPAVDLVILDLILPDGHGLDWLRQLRQTSNLPVIILSSHDDTVDSVVGLELGADDYVGKPFSPREMIARARAVLRRAAPGHFREGGGAQAGALRVDRERREAWAGSRRLELSRIEFDLLGTFVGAPGRVFEREHLLDRVWGAEVIVSERTVDVHIKSLRKKLVLAGLAAETIETVRGVGYKLAD